MSGRFFFANSTKTNAAIHLEHPLCNMRKNQRRSPLSPCSFDRLLTMDFMYLSSDKLLIGNIYNLDVSIVTDIHVDKLEHE